MKRDRSLTLDPWLGVEIRHLAALEAIAQEGTFGKAAARLGYTQSAISQQIATLERIVGAQLIDRPGGPRRVSLTEAGTVLLGHAESIVGRLKAAQADLAALSAGESGSLRVGTFQSVGARVLPEVMRRFAKTWPHVDVVLHESNSDRDLATLVERGELDVAFAQLPIEAPSLEWFELLRDDYVVVANRDSSIAKNKRPPSLAEIANQPLIGFRQCRATEIVVDQLRASGHEPRFVSRSDDNGVVQGLAGAGIGIAVMPRLTVDANDESIVIIDLGHRLAPRIVGMVWHADRYHSAAARSFVQIAQEVAAETGAALAA